MSNFLYTVENFVRKVITLACLRNLGRILKLQGSDMKEYNQEIQTTELIAFLRKHPGMMASLAYALLTLCGLIYSYAFYAKFNIPILKLADLSDMLIAGISEPAAILMFSGGIALAVISDLLFAVTYRARERWRKKPESLKKRLFLMLYYTPKRKIEVLGGLLFILIAYPIIFVELYAEHQSEQIKEGTGSLVLLSSEKYQETPLFLLGSTTNFVITYDIATEKAVLTPIEEIKQIIPQKNQADDESPDE